MRKYDSYKDSGIEWIGEIPSHWQVIKLGLLLSANDGGVWGNDGGNINVLRSTEINVDGTWNFDEEPAKRDLNETEIRKALLLKGDLLVTKSSGSELHIGKTAIVDEHVAKMNCCYSNFMQRLRIKDGNNPRLYFHFLNSLLAREQYNYLSNTTTGLANLGAEVLANVKISVPSPEEQTSIAAYLDRKTAEIDKLIADKKRLLELYEEEKTAIINQAVTKGINPDVPMKDSGIEWLGDIPEHWEVKRIRHIAQIFGRIGYRGYKTTDLVSKGEGAITISPSNMKGYFMGFSDCSYLSWEKYDESPEIMIYNGDILFVKTGSTYGKSSLVENLPEKATINPQIIVFKEIQCNNKLLWYIIKSEYTQFQVEGTVVGGTIPTISQAKINNYKFVISPDEKEQQAIVDFIDKECSRIDTQMKRTNKLISLLMEYRTALISEVVTGKIKVI